MATVIQNATVLRDERSWKKRRFEENTDYVFYYPEAGSSKFFRNICTYQRSYKMMQATGCFKPVVSTKLHGVTFPEYGDAGSPEK
jgi:hypothetical protein